MLGRRTAQRGLFEADNRYLGFVGEGTFYGFLACHRVESSCDEDFAGFCSPDYGRPSVPPSLLATALLLQTHDRISDEEAQARADYDLRWKADLGVELGERPFAKSTLHHFRGQLVLKEKMRAVFQRSLEYARQSGYLKKRELKAVPDTTYILGRGAVKDTYNLLADGMRQLLTYMEPEIACFVLVTNLNANVIAKATSIPVWKAGQLLVEDYTLSIDETIQPPSCCKARSRPI